MENITITITKEQLSVLRGQLRHDIATEECEKWLNKLIDLSVAIDNQTK